MPSPLVTDPGAGDRAVLDLLVLARAAGFPTTAPALQHLGVFLARQAPAAFPFSFDAGVQTLSSAGLIATMAMLRHDRTCGYDAGGHAYLPAPAPAPPNPELAAALARLDFLPRNPARLQLHAELFFAMTEAADRHRGQPTFHRTYTRYCHLFRVSDGSRAHRLRLVVICDFLGARLFPGRYRPGRAGSRA